MSKKSLVALENLKKSIEDLDNRISAFNNQKLALVRQLRKQCTHPEKYLRSKAGWFPSGEDAALGYIKPSMPERWCTLCGFRESGEVSKNILDKWDHSWIPDSLSCYRVLKGNAMLGEDDGFSESREKTGKDFLSFMTR